MTDPATAPRLVVRGVPSDLLTDLKVLAVKRRVSLSALVVQLLTEAHARTMKDLRR